jgi:hypothetical protein
MFVTYHTSTRSISIMSNKIEFSPAIPWVEPFDVQKRIQELRGYLDPKNPEYERKEQHANIRAAIQLYEDGKIDGSGVVCITEGKVVTEQEMFEGTTWAWVEVYSFKSF